MTGTQGVVVGGAVLLVGWLLLKPKKAAAAATSTTPAQTVPTPTCLPEPWTDAEATQFFADHSTYNFAVQTFKWDGASAKWTKDMEGGDVVRNPLTPAPTAAPYDYIVLWTKAPKVTVVEHAWNGPPPLPVTLCAPSGEGTPCSGGEIDASGNCVCPQGEKLVAGHCIEDKSCPPGQVWDDATQGCVSPPSPPSEGAVIGEELPAMGSPVEMFDQGKIQSHVTWLLDHNIPNAGLVAWTHEVLPMAGQPAAFYALALNSKDPIILVRSAAWLALNTAPQSFPQAAANLLAFATIAAVGLSNTALWYPAVHDAAETGAAGLYGTPDDVASFAVAVEELRAMLTTDKNVIDSTNLNALGVKQFLSSPPVSLPTTGLDKYVSELQTGAWLLPGAKSNFNALVAAGNKSGLLAAAQTLKTAVPPLPQSAAQLELLASLVGVTDIKALVPQIRNLAEKGAGP